MTLLHQYLIAGLWGVWLLIWLAAAGTSKENARRESGLSRASHGIPLGLAGWLLIERRFPLGALNARFMPEAEWPFVVGAVIVALGLGFAVWARFYLGRNWSGTVTIKRDHELIRTGPYRWVRNPIYTGMLLGFIGSALARGQWSGVLAVAIAFAAIWHKVRIEERVLHETFGAQYDAYRNEVASLIPLVL
jgi:protein-S-isoprenylcysteine O-methyltransferase Ste14